MGQLYRREQEGLSWEVLSTFSYQGSSVSSLKGSPRLPREASYIDISLYEALSASSRESSSELSYQASSTSLHEASSMESPREARFSR